MTLPIGLNGPGAQPLAVMELEVEPELVLVLTNVLEPPQKLRLAPLKPHATVSISLYSQFKNFRFDKIHILILPFFTTFKSLNYHFTQNSHFCISLFE